MTNARHVFDLGDAYWYTSPNAGVAMYEGYGFLTESSPREIGSHFPYMIRFEDGDRHFRMFINQTFNIWVFQDDSTGEYKVYRGYSCHEFIRDKFLEFGDPYQRQCFKCEHFKNAYHVKGKLRCPKRKAFITPQSTCKRHVLGHHELRMKIDPAPSGEDPAVEFIPSAHRTAYNQQLKDGLEIDEWVSR